MPSSRTETACSMSLKLRQANNYAEKGGLGRSIAMTASETMVGTMAGETQRG